MGELSPIKRQNDFFRSFIITWELSGTALLDVGIPGHVSSHRENVSSIYSWHNTKFKVATKHVLLQ